MTPVYAVIQKTARIKIMFFINLDVVAHWPAFQTAEGAALGSNQAALKV